MFCIFHYTFETSMRLSYLRSKQFPRKLTRKLYISKKQAPILLSNLNKLVQAIIEGKQHCPIGIKPKYAKKYIFLQFLYRMEKKKYPQFNQQKEQKDGKQSEIHPEKQYPIQQQKSSFEGEDTFQHTRKGRKVKNPRAERILADTILKSEKQEYTIEQIRQIYAEAVQTTFGTQQQLPTAKIYSMLKRLNLVERVMVKKMPKRVSKKSNTYRKRLFAQSQNAKQDVFEAISSPANDQQIIFCQANQLQQVYSHQLNYQNSNPTDNYLQDEMIQIDTPQEYRISDQFNCLNNESLDLNRLLGKRHILSLEQQFLDRDEQNYDIDSPF